MWPKSAGQFIDFLLCARLVAALAQRRRRGAGADARPPHLRLYANEVRAALQPAQKAGRFRREIHTDG